MLELSGTLHYKKSTGKQFSPYEIVSKDLFINYPDNAGVIKENENVIVINHHLVETTLKKMFFEVTMEIDLKTIYYYELEKDVLFKVDVRLKNEKDVNRFLRKNKIQNLLTENAGGN
jgi:hypothetical protein